MFDDIYIASAQLKTVGASDVAALEATLGVSVPPGYGEFVTQLGDGSVNTLFRVNMPDKLPALTREWQSATATYFFWEKGKRTLPKEKVLQSIPIANTMSGDQVIFHPGTPGKIFVLPRNEEKIYVAGDNFEAVIRWFCESGKIARRQRFKFFDANDPRSSQLHLRARARDVDFSQLRAELRALKIHDFAVDEPAEIPLKGEEVLDPYVELFVREFSGSVAVMPEESHFVARIHTSCPWTGPDTPPKLQQVLTCLERFGFAKGW